jgi:hypothetical protein
MIEVRKSGLRIQFSEELINECEFDIVQMMMAEAGRALGRHKEQKAFYEWLTHSHTVFDNSIRASIPAAGTTGVDYYGNYNDTMSIDDFLDLVIAVYNNEYTPTDLVMHPLAWTSFVRNGLTGVFTAPFEREVTRDKPNASFKIGPDAINGKLPFSFNAHLSPFSPFDKINKTFDMFCVDRNNVGVLIVKEDLRTDEFDDPSRDIRNVKFIERYGFGTFNEGRAICTAKNISMAKGFPYPERVHVIDSANTQYNP